MKINRITLLLMLALTGIGMHAQETSSPALPDWMPKEFRSDSRPKNESWQRPDSNTQKPDKSLVGYCTVGQKPQHPSGPINNGMQAPADLKPDTVVLLSNGKDMADQILRALKEHHVVVLDGKKGPFLFSHTIALQGLTDRQLLGTNDATLQTMFRLTPDIHAMLDRHHVRDFSTQAGEAVTLSNGRQVSEPCEAFVRQLLIDSLADPQEQYARAGFIRLDSCKRFTMRRLTLQGPGAIDVGGSDLLTISHGSTNIWVDSCCFWDGQDGNADVNSHSDFITFSRCTFGYSELSYQHQNSNLIGASDNAEKAKSNCLRTTFYRCQWLAGCDQRMPMVRFGTVHLCECEWHCPESTLCVDARKESLVVIDRCVFDADIRKPYNQSNDSRGIQFAASKHGSKPLPQSPHKPNLPYRL